MPNERYLDANGLNTFWGEVKNYVDQSSSNSGGTLLNSLNRQIAIMQSQWTEVDGVYQCVVSCEGVITNETVQNIYSTPAASQQSSYEECGVKCVTQGTNTLTYQAKTPPPNLLMYVTIVNAGETTTNLVAWSPQMTSNTTPAPYVVSGSNLFNQQTNYYIIFDGVYTGTAIGFVSPDSMITFDFGKDAIVYGITFTYNSSLMFPSSITISGSADGTNWNTIQVISIDDSFEPAADTPYKHVFSSPVSYRYFKFDNAQKSEDHTYNAVISDIMFLRPASDVGEVG